MPTASTIFALKWLPTKLAEWIGENLQDDLGFPGKADPKKGWTLEELNRLLGNHVVKDRNAVCWLHVSSGSLSCQRDHAG